MSPSPAKRPRRSSRFEDENQSPSTRRSLKYASDSPLKSSQILETLELNEEADDDSPRKARTSSRLSSSRASLDRSPSTPSSQSKAKRKLDITPLHKQALTPRSSQLFGRELRVSLAPIEEGSNTQAFANKLERTPVSNSKIRRKLDVTPPDEEAVTPKSNQQALKEVEAPTTPKSAKRTQMQKEAVTPKSNRQHLKEVEAPTTPKSAKGTPVRKSLHSTPQSGKFKIDPSTPRTPIDEARANLHISAIPKSLPCRQTEFDTVYNFVVRKIESQSGGVMYISGVPGTGKTATVHKVIQVLEEEDEKGEIDPFIFVEVNALRVSEPRQAYVKIWKDLTGDTATAAAAQSLLEKRFSRPAKKATIILVDELDYLCNRRQDVIYNILDWTTKRDSRLIVLTIANTMDLPERTLKGRVTSRMGLTRLMFQPYSHTQLQQIVTNRLDKHNVFHPDAVQLVSRKVAAVSGDARRALDICRRATEFVDSDKMLVKIEHVQKVLNSIFTGPRILTIRNCSEIEKLILRSLRDESQRTGVEETYLKKMYQALTVLCGVEGLYVPNIGCISQLCTKLAGMGLVIAENNNAYLYRKLLLNVSIDDLHFALELDDGSLKV